jgi:hypothetical protein
MLGTPGTGTTSPPTEQGLAARAINVVPDALMRVSSPSLGSRTPRELFGIAGSTARY